MRAKLMLMIGAVLSIVAVAIGVTYALFTASAGPAQNNFTAGSLCLNSRRDNSDPVPGPMFYIVSTPPPPGAVPGNQPTGLWAPGDNHTRTLIVDNPCLGAWLDSVKANLVSGDPSLAGSLMVTITMAEPGQVSDQLVAQAPLSQFLAGNVALKYPVVCSPAICGAGGKRVPLPNSSMAFMHFNVAFDINAGNALQGKDLVVDFVVNGIQSANNP